LPIVKKVGSIQEDPFHFLEHYEGTNCLKLRIGDYRALVDVDLHGNAIHIRVVGHRRSYKQFAP